MSLKTEEIEAISVDANEDFFLYGKGDFAYETATAAVAVKEVIAEQIEDEMYRSNITKKALANMMCTSRASLDRLLDPKNNSVTLHTLEKVALALNKRLKVELA